MEPREVHDAQIEQFREHGIAAGTAGLAQHRQAVVRGRGFGRTAEQPDRFVVQPNPDGGYTARKPGTYGVEVGNGLAVEGAGGFIPLFEVAEPPGKPLPNRRERRAHARQLARQLNRGRRRHLVAVQPANRETCQHGQLVGQCTECSKTTGRPPC